MSLLDPSLLCGLTFYELQRGPGYVLCYRVQLCGSILAIQNTCDEGCCENDSVAGELAFEHAAQNHNYYSGLQGSACACVRQWVMPCTCSCRALSHHARRVVPFADAQVNQWGRGSWRSSTRLQTTSTSA